MGYPIVFQTKVIKTADGKIIHFTRQGCNNDEEGRKKDVYKVAGIYDNETSFLNYANDFVIRGDTYKNGGPFELKVGCKKSSYVDYGAHLIRMMKRATTLDTLSVHEAEVYKGITVVYEDDTKKSYSPKEWENVCYDYIYNNTKKAKKITPIFETVYESEDILKQVFQAEEAEYTLIA